MDGDDATYEPHTSVTLEVGQVSVTITTSAGWTPEMIEDSLTRVKRVVVATVQQLGLVGETAEETP